ncbi:MAG TPA: response regulator transcription factor [Dokdonella sp.]|uniref:response regulator transcription factor n=1 Tax=Dokdonella sp. TaxID=2291710 RepID=UPI002D7F8D03|nr:response regulator transcription factor [Dokdonella sp.]HET9033149.1 response regulator transcription factor [Dokdonella sp.]
MRVLIVEDDPVIANFVSKGLREAGHNADALASGVDGLHRAQHESYDAIVLDRMLPGLDGIEIVRRLRADGNRIPVLMLSSLAEVEQRVEGLRHGADDYLAKPFAFVEVLARLEALLRRQSGSAAEVTRLRVADLEMDLLKRRVRRGGQLIELQPREFRLLEYLMRHADQVVTRTMLLEAVWDYHFDPQTNVIDVHISRLRQKLDRDRDTALLHTVRGSGYLLGLRS